MPFDPSSLAGLRVWIRAKDLGAGGSSVTTWPDQSGLGNNATTGGSTATVAAASTPSGGKSLALTGQGYNFAKTVTGGIIAATASSEPIGGYEASKTIDGDTTGTRWLGNDPSVGTPQWLRLQMPSAKVVTYYKLWGHPSSTSYNPTDWTFQGSNDGTTWTTLDTQTGVAWPSTSTAPSFTFSNTNAYLYYRLNITNNNGATDYVSISEIILEPVATGGELWVVVKAAATSAPDSRGWQFGNSSQVSYYPYNTGQVIDNFGVTTHSDLWTPTISIASWRLYRVKLDAGQMDVWLDNTLQKTKTGLTMSWASPPALSQSFQGNIAEMVVTVGAPLSSTDVSNLITYFNTEHGLTVSGGSGGAATTTGTAPVSVASSSASRLLATTTSSAPISVGASSAAALLGGVTTATGTAPVSVESSASTSLIVPATGSGPISVGSSSSVYQFAATTGTAPITVGSSSNAGIFTGAFSLAFAGTGTMAVTASTITLTSVSLAFAGTSTMETGTLLTVTTASLAFSGSSRLRAILPREHIVDPRTGKPQYQLRAVDSFGVPLGDVAPVATMSEAAGILNDTGTFGFTLPTRDPKSALVTPVAGSQPPGVQLWRGKYLEGWWDITKAVPSSDGTTTTYQCADRRWTLDHVHIGKSPLRNLLLNGEFDMGEANWGFSYEAGSIPAAPPLHQVVASDFTDGGHALEIKGADKSQLVIDVVETEAVFAPNSATYLSGGEAAIQSVGATIPNGSNVHIVGHTAYNYLDGDYGDGLALSLDRARAARATLHAQNPTLTFSLPPVLGTPSAIDSGLGVAGRGRYEPVASNDTYAGQRKNRRVVISYQGTQTATGHKQYAYQRISVTQPTSKKRPLEMTFAGWFNITDWIGPSKNGYGVYVQAVKASAPTKIVDSAYSTIDANTPRNKWTPADAAISIPADGNAYTVEVRFYPPAGTALWTRAGLYPDDVLGFYDEDEATIVQRVIEHAQDPAMGRASLGLATNCRATGVLRTREYLYRDRMPIAQAVDEFPSLFRGVDIDLAVTATTRTVTTYFPRQGDASDVVLALGRNVVTYDAPVDVTQAATSVIVQADGIGTHREEGFLSDPSGLGGMILERVISAEKETPVNELDEAAKEGISRFGRPIVFLSVTCDPRQTSDLIDRLSKGDTCRAIVSDGRTNIDGTFRVTERRLNPNTDALSYELAMEV